MKTKVLTRKNLKLHDKALSLLMALSVMFNCFTMVKYLDTEVSAAVDGLRFSGESNAEFSSGAVSYVDPDTNESGFRWTADGNTAGHQFMYRVDFNISIDGAVPDQNGNYIPEESVFIIIPSHLLKNREGSYADLCEPAYPELGGPYSDDTDYAYSEFGDYVVIRNIVGFKKAVSEWTKIAYTTLDQNTAYVDSDFDNTDEFWAYVVLSTELQKRDNETEDGYQQRVINKINEYRSNTPANGDDFISLTAQRFCIDTTAQLESMDIVYPTGKSASWPGGIWGDPISGNDLYNDELYNYVEFTVSSYVTANQPYIFRLENSSIVDPNNYGHPVILKYYMEGNDGPTDIAKTDIPTTKTDAYRNDKVLVAYLKSEYDLYEQYRLKFSTKGVVDPDDNVDAPTYATKSLTWIYDKPRYTGAPGSVITTKYGTTNWEMLFRDVKWEYASYDLKKFVNEEINAIEGNLRFCVKLSSNFTSELFSGDPDDPTQTNDPQNYNRKIWYVIDDDSLFLNDQMQTDNGSYVSEDHSARLQNEDYDLNKIQFYYYAKDFKNKNGELAAGNGDFSNDVVIYDLKVGDTWVYDAVKMNISTRTISTSDAYILDENNNHQSVSDSDFDYLKDYLIMRGSSTGVSSENRNRADGIIYLNKEKGVKGFRFRVLSSHHTNHIYVYPYYRLNGNENTRAKVRAAQDDNSSSYISWLSNIAKVKVFYDVGAVYDPSDPVNPTNLSNVKIYTRNVIGRDMLKGQDYTPNLYKETTLFNNDKNKKEAQIGWKVHISEEAPSDGGIDYILQNSGTLYDLLPKGCEVLPDSISVTLSDGTVIDDPDYEINSAYGENQRTMLIVRLKNEFEGADLYYTTTYKWDNVKDLGNLLLNSVAYKTGNDNFSGGATCSEAPDYITEGDEFVSLDPSDDKLYFFTEYSTVVDVLSYGSAGLTKQVKGNRAVDGSVGYARNVITGIGNIYSYKLRQENPAGTASRNMVFFDSLENARSNGRESDWHGTLLSVNASQPAMKYGAKPVVYYSDEPNLDVSLHHDLSEVSGGSKVWKTASEFGDISRATAVAVDISKDENGEVITYPEESSFYVEIFMRAPYADETSSADPKAYNSVGLLQDIVSTGNDGQGSSTGNYIENGLTSVTLRVQNKFRILKLDGEDSSKPVRNAVFHLEGESDYQTHYDITKSTLADGSIDFGYLEKGNKYTLTELSVSDDYLIYEDPISVEVRGDGKVFLNGREYDRPDEFTFVLDDPLRRHADIHINKRDPIGNPIDGIVKFYLEGSSEYHHQIQYDITAENGSAVIENLELGEYKLVETLTVPGYILCKNEYKVKVLDNDLATIEFVRCEAGANEDILRTFLKAEEDGSFTFINEKEHDFSILKVGSTDPVVVPLEGAEFLLSGRSIYGKSISKTAKSGVNGHADFKKLPAGTYTLQETKAPDNCNLDPTEYTVDIDIYGTVTINGLDRVEGTGEYIYYFVNTSNIVVIKKWHDDLKVEDENGIPGRDSRFASEHYTTPHYYPNIHISSEVPVSEAFFDGRRNPKDDEPDYTSILARLYNNEYDTPNLETYTYKTAIKGFYHSTEPIQDLEGNAVRIDDGATLCKIWAWKDENDNVFWWSDAATVYLTDKAGGIFTGLTNAEEIDLSGINSSKMEDMSCMFKDCQSLTSIDDFNKLNISKVKSLKEAFHYCFSLQSIDLSGMYAPKLESMALMFTECVSLQTVNFDGRENDTSDDFCNKPEDVQNAVLNSMRSTFAGTKNLENIKFGKKFDTSNVDSFYRTFGSLSLTRDCNVVTPPILRGTDLKNEQLEELDLSNIKVTDKATTCKAMFRGLSNMTKITFADGHENDFYGWNTENVRDMSYMFAYCESLTKLDVSGLNTENVDSTTNSTVTTESGEQVPINTGSFFGMFSNCISMTDLKIYPESYPQSGVTLFNTSKATTMAYMFNNCKSLTSIYLPVYKTPIRIFGFDTSSVKDMQVMFGTCVSLTSLDVSNFDTQNVENMYAMFYGCNNLATLQINPENSDNFTFKTDNVTNMDSMFEGCNSLTSIDVSKFDTGKVTTMKDMFFECKQVKDLEIKNFNTENVTDMSRMFANCWNLKVDAEDKVLDVSHFKTLSLKDVTNMFAHCREVKEIKLFAPDKVYTDGENAGKPFFNTENVTSMIGFFQNCHELTTLDVSQLETGSVTDMSFMFHNDHKLESLDISNFNTVKVTDMHNMFYNYGGSALNFTENFKTDKVTNMRFMFSYYRSKAALDLSKFDTSSVTNMSHMFFNYSGPHELDISTFKTNLVTNMTEMFGRNRADSSYYFKDENDISYTELHVFVDPEIWSTEGLTDEVVYNDDNPDYNIDNSTVFRYANGLVGQYGFDYREHVDRMGKEYAHVDVQSNNPDERGYFSERTNNSGSGGRTKTYTTSSGAGTDQVIHYDLSSRNCKVSVISDDTYVYTFENVPPGNYCAWEDYVHGYDSDHMGTENTVAVVNRTATINNWPKNNPPTFGSLKVTKLLVGEYEPEDENSEFSFELKLTDKNGNVPQNIVTFGAVSFTNGKAKFMLKHGQSAVFDSIPEGYHYTVTEIQRAGFELVGQNDLTGTIVADTEQSVTFENRKTRIPDPVSVTVKKTVTGRFGNNDTVYPVSVIFTGLAPDTVYSLSNGETFNSGSGDTEVSLPLKNGESITVIDIPVGSHYRIIEAAGDYKAGYEITDANDPDRLERFTNAKKNSNLSTGVEEAEEGEDVTVNVINEKTVVQDLVIKKQTVNASDDNSDVFTFTLYLSNLPERSSVRILPYGIITANTDGEAEASFTLKGGESVTVKGVPYNTHCRILENSSDYVAEYTVQYDNSDTPYASVANDFEKTSLETVTFVIADGTDNTVTFTNTKQSRGIRVKKLVDILDDSIPYTQYSTHDFEYELTFTGLDPNAEYEAVFTSSNTSGILRTESFTADSDGNAAPEFTLRHNQSFYIGSLPVNATYQINEKGRAGYYPSYTVSANDGAIVEKLSDSLDVSGEALSTEVETVDLADKDISFTFTNSYVDTDPIPVTVNKTDNNGVGLAGAEFELYYKERARELSYGINSPVAEPDSDASSDTGSDGRGDWLYLVASSADEWSNMLIVFYDAHGRVTQNSPATPVYLGNLSYSIGPRAGVSTNNKNAAGFWFKAAIPQGASSFRVTSPERDSAEGSIFELKNSGTYHFIKDYTPSDMQYRISDDLNGGNYGLELIYPVFTVEDGAGITASEPDDIPDPKGFDIHLATVVTGSDGSQEYIKWLKTADGSDSEADSVYLDHTLDDVGEQAALSEVLIKKKGTYYWKESKAPEGYEVYEEKLTFKNKAGQGLLGTISLDVEDEPLNGRALLKKTARTKVGNTDVGDPLAGAEFRLARKSAPQTALTFARIKQQSVYRLVASDISDEEYIRLSRSGEYETTNELVQFNVPDPEHEGQTLSVSVNKLRLYTDNLVTDQNGLIKAENLPWGEYVFVETRAPEFYVTDERYSEGIDFRITKEECEVTKTVDFKNEARTSYIRLFEHINDRQERWGDPTFVFKIRQTQEYVSEYDPVTEKWVRVLREIPDYMQSVKIVALTVNDDGTSTEVVRDEFSGWYVESTDEQKDGAAEYGGQFDIDTQGRIKVEPGSYEITRVPVSRYEFVTSATAGQYDADSPAGLQTETEGEHKEKVIISELMPEKAIDVHYYDRIGYYDKFSQVETAVNNFFKLDAEKNSLTAKGIRIEYNNYVPTSGESQTIDIRAEGVKAYVIYSDGRERLMDREEREGISISCEESDISYSEGIITIAEPSAHSGREIILTARYSGLSCEMRLKFE